MTAPAAPNIIARFGENSIAIRWLPVLTAAAYRLYVGGATAPTTLQATIAAAPLDADGWLSFNVTHSFKNAFLRLTAVNSNGEESGYSNEEQQFNPGPSAIYLTPSGVADYVAVQAAITALAATGGKLTLAPGTYDFSGGGISITANSRVHVSGHGAVFQLGANVTGITINQGSIGGNTRGAIVEGVRIEGGDIASTIGVALIDTNYPALVQVQIDNCGRGILEHCSTANQFVEGVDLEDVLIRTPGVYGIEFRRTGGTNSFGQHNYRGVMISNVINGAIGVLLPTTTSIYRSRMHIQVWIGVNGTGFSLDGDTDGATLQFSVEGATGSTGNVAMVVGANSTNLDKASIDWYVTGTINTEFTVSASKDFAYRQGRHFKGHTANSTSPIRVQSHADSAAKITLGINGSSGGRITLGNGTGTNDVYWERAGTAYAVHSGGFKATSLFIQTKAGTPADGDLTGTVQDGAIVIDTTALKIWVRVGGAWKSVTVA